MYLQSQPGPNLQGHLFSGKPLKYWHESCFLDVYVATVYITHESNRFSAETTQSPRNDVIFGPGLHCRTPHIVTVVLQIKWRKTTRYRGKWTLTSALKRAATARWLSTGELIVHSYVTSTRCVMRRCCPASLTGRMRGLAGTRTPLRRGWS